MGDTTEIFNRKIRHWKTTLAGLLFPLAMALRHSPAASWVPDVLEGLAGALLGSLAADKQTPPKPPP